MAGNKSIAAMRPELDNLSGATAPSAAALDDRSALLLWQRSTALAGIKE